jgi:hypothetical protein
VIRPPSGIASRAFTARFHLFDLAGIGDEVHGVGSDHDGELDFRS